MDQFTTSREGARQLRPLSSGIPASVPISADIRDVSRQAQYRRSMGDCREEAVQAARSFTDTLSELDRRARREHRTLPSADERRAVLTAFWEGLIPVLEGVASRAEKSVQLHVRSDVQMLLNPWLLRSRFWSRSWLKPHGFAGDYRILEWMYDLERDPCADPVQPATVNLLDELYKSVHSVQAVWHRRAWFRTVIARQVRVGQTPVRVLDVACGGSRYIRDVIESQGPHTVRGTFFDQDPAALAFVGSRLPNETRDMSRILCAPVSRIHELIPAPVNSDGAPFDVAISTGLFDYLPTDDARRLLAYMTSVTRPGGTVAMCNFSPADRSKLVKQWIADWRLIYRTDAELTALFAPGQRPVLSHSPDGGLIYASLKKERTASDGGRDHA
jgi:SAM-dependent methyltransferase